MADEEEVGDDGEEMEAVAEQAPAEKGGAGKKGKGGAQMTPKQTFAHSDAFHRMNFLYQAAYLMAPETPSLARVYAGNMSDPEVKRTLCKYCDSVLIPGVSAIIRMSAKKRPHEVTTCLTCQTTKKIAIRRPPNKQRGAAGGRSESETQT